MSTPSLPQHDPTPALRQPFLVANRERYVHDPELLPPFVLCRSRPDAEAFTAYSVGERLTSALGVPANRVAVRLASLFDKFDELQDYEDLFRLFETPAIVAHWRRDQAFAEQRLAGVECRLLRRIDRLPDHLRLDPAEFAAIAGLSLDEAANAGRLLLADYALLDGIEAGAHAGLARFMHAPLALFCWCDRPVPGDSFKFPRGQLVPIAIQLDQRPTARNLHTPLDGLDWLIARTVVQAADYTLATLASHLGRAHLGMEPFATATARQLAERHPLGVLLRPHLRGTIAHTDLARRVLLNPGGYIERLFAPTLPGSLEIAARAHRSWRFDDWALPRDLAVRGVADREALPHYPFRDDGLLVWHALEDFVANYLALFYTDDADLAADPELHAWHIELHDRVPGLPAWPLRAAQLTEVVTNILFTTGPYHSALNGRQREYATFIPTLPMALYGPVPAERGVSDEATLFHMLPPQRAALEQLELVELLTATATAPLGQYGEDDPMLTEPERVCEVVTAFQERLASIEGEVLRRNTRREFPYLGMLPSTLANGASI